MARVTRTDFLNKHDSSYRKLIKGFDTRQVTPVGYDFRAGECINLTLGTRIDLTLGGSYKINHGDFVIIVTREILSLGGRDDVFGQVFSKVSFAVRGLSHVGTKIDPGFEGPLALTFKNEGYDIIEITQDTAICNVALETIPKTGEKYSLGSFHYPVLSERPRLPLPLTREHWHTEGLGRWYSREEFEAYLQWSDELFALSKQVGRDYAELDRQLEIRLNNARAKIETAYDNLRQEWTNHRKQTEDDLKDFETLVNEKVDRADRIYAGAVLTIFIAMISVVGVLISAAALFFNEIKIQRPAITDFSLYIWAFVTVVTFAFFIILLYRLLRGQKARMP